MATIALNYYCDLNQAVKVQYIDGNVFSGDNAGNTISVFVMDGDQPATIGGSVSADVIRADGSTVAVSGALDGNRAYVILPQACYAVPGSISIVIKNTQNTTITTIAALVGNVYRSSTDEIVDPGTIIPSISSLIAAIDAAIGSIPADYSALLASIAANYSPSKTYPVGAYCWEAGVLKRCIVPITSAETYTAAHWTNAVIGDDLSALKSAIDGKDIVENLFNDLVNYNYDEFVNLPADPSSTTSTQIGVVRNYNRIILNGTATSNRIVKVSAGVSRGGSSGPSSYTTGFTPISGHTYRATLKYISGTYVTPSGKNAPATLSVYKLGESSSTGEYRYPVAGGIDFERVFTADGSVYNLGIYINNGASFTNTNYLVLLEDITEIPTEQAEVNELKIDDALSNEKTGFRKDRINYGYNTPYNLYPSATSGASSIWVWRRGNNIKLKVPSTNTQNARVKLNGEVKRTISDAEVQSWTSDSVSLTAGKNYTIRYIVLNSDETIPGLSISIYRSGESKGIGTYSRIGNVYAKTFTAEENETYEIYLYISRNTAIDTEIAVILSEADMNESGENVYTEELADTVSKARAELTAPAFVFMLTTDNHRFKAATQNFEDQIDNMRNVAAAIKVDAVIDLGDLIEGDQTQATTKAQAYPSIDLFRSLGIPFLFTCGNHDINPYRTNADVFTQEQVYQVYYTDIRKAVFDPTISNTQYYVDFDDIGVRVVSLNSSTIRLKSGSYDYYGFPDGVGDFMAEALNTNKKVIVISHLSSIPTQVWNSPSIDRRDDVNNAIQAFINNGGSLIMLTGHSHIDVAFINPWLSISSVCQRFQQADTTGAGYQEITNYIDELTAPERSNEDYTKDAWTVGIYKPGTNELAMIRFGAGSDRYYHNAPIAPATLTTKLSGTITWSSSDTSVATVSDGVVTGVASGRCAVLAKDESGNYECWTIVVS